MIPSDRLKTNTRMKRIIIIVTLILLSTGIKVVGQQQPMVTQYMFNPFLYNPAIAGTYNYYQIRTNHRLQWAGFNPSPITNAISAFGPHPNKKYDMGYGASIYYDNTEPTSRLSASGSYGYNLSLTDEIRLSMGVSLGILQYKIDQSKIMMPEAHDPAWTMGVESAIKPDASVGFYMYSTMFHVGLSAVNLFNSKVEMYEWDNATEDPDNEVINTVGRLKTHFYLHAGYTYFINREFSLEPTIFLKYVYPAPPQVDIDCRVIYQKIVYGGLMVRTQDAVGVYMGYIHEKKIFVGYSIDIHYGAIGPYARTSHELMLGFRFNDIK